MDTSANCRVLLTETNADGRPLVFQLYRAEQIDNLDDKNIYLWIRRCELFVSMDAVMKYFQKIGIEDFTMHFQQHELFQELWIVENKRGQKWYLTKAPIYD